VKKVLKYVIGSILFVTFVYQATLYYVNTNIAKRVPNNSYHDCHKVWSARGIYEKRPEQNSLKSLSKAIEAGYIGFEIDFYYDIGMDRFIISHNKPKRDKNGELHYTLKEGKLLTLQEVFEKVGKGHYFWLDYKNLDRLSKEDSLKALKRLEKISRIYDIKERIYLEGCTPWHLRYYDNAGFKTLLSFHPLPKSSLFHSLSSNFFKIVYYFSSANSLAIQYGKKSDPKYTGITAGNLKGIPQFIFHVPVSKELAKNLIRSEDIRVVLIGRDKSVNFGDINNCRVK
jgi:hypothetical protein